MFRRTARRRRSWVVTSRLHNDGRHGDRWPRRNELKAAFTVLPSFVRKDVRIRLESALSLSTDVHNDIFQLSQTRTSRSEKSRNPQLVNKSSEIDFFVYADSVTTTGFSFATSKGIECRHLRHTDIKLMS